MASLHLLGMVLATLGTAGQGLDVPVPDLKDFATTWDESGFSHALWAQVLADHVDPEGLVDYASIKTDRRFNEYLYRLGNTSPSRVGDENARLAFWINAYNALAIQGVLQTLPVDPTGWADYSVLGVKQPGVEGNAFFVGLRFQVGGQRYTLDEIEKAVLFSNAKHMKRSQEFYGPIGVGPADPRLHFALVCCARGCPRLRLSAYTASGVRGQLDEALRRFVANPNRARFDRSKRVLHVSQLLDWYRGDLTNTQYEPHAKSVAAFLGRYVEDEALARSLTTERWKTSYIEYDWKLNLRRKQRE